MLAKLADLTYQCSTAQRAVSCSPRVGATQVQQQQQDSHACKEEPQPLSKGNKQEIHAMVDEGVTSVPHALEEEAEEAEEAAAGTADKGESSSGERQRIANDRRGREAEETQRIANHRDMAWIVHYMHSIKKVQQEINSIQQHFLARKQAAVVCVC